MSPLQETFSEFPTSPTRLIALARLFNQRKKFFVAGGSEQGRFRHAAPNHFRLPANEFRKLIQHPGVNRRIGDHAPAFVRFGLPRFELRLD